MHSRCTEVGHYLYTENASNESSIPDDYEMGTVCLAFSDCNHTRSISPPLQFFCGYSILAWYFKVFEGKYLAKNIQSSFEPKMAFVVSKLLFNVSTPAKLSV